MPLILDPYFSETSLCLQLFSCLRWWKPASFFQCHTSVCVCVCQEWSVVCGSSQALGLKPVHFSCIWLHLNCGPVHHHNFSLPFDWISDIIQGTNLISSNILFFLSFLCWDVESLSLREKAGERSCFLTVHVDINLRWSLIFIICVFDL